MREIEVSSFAKKMYNLLHSQEYVHLVGWCDAGDNFVIKSQKAFQEELFPNYFKNASFNSFVRQLNMYGFKRISDGRKTRGTNLDSSWFEHPYFKRSREDLLSNIHRISNQAKKIAAANGDEANSNLPITNAFIKPRPEHSKKENIKDKLILPANVESNSNEPKNYLSERTLYNRSLNIKENEIYSRNNAHYNEPKRSFETNRPYNNFNRNYNEQRDIYNSVNEQTYQYSNEVNIPQISTPRNTIRENNLGSFGNHNTSEQTRSAHNDIHYDGMDLKAFLALVDPSNEFSKISPAEYYSREKEIHTSLINYLANSGENRIPQTTPFPLPEPTPQTRQLFQSATDNPNNPEIKDEIDRFVDEQTCIHRKLLSQLKFTV
ncbi:hypothetical protein K502DRAFT_300105 [Neoconidiobolus thromboides FSU 785]|nr:hypothetical protein K502DRAFT_300105 [Neoconidiobolus thromboides FSU 785]